MKGSEFLRKLKKFAETKDLPFKHIKNRGKGSHSTVYVGDKHTVIRNIKDELKTGTYKAMLKQLGIDESELG